MPTPPRAPLRLALSTSTRRGSAALLRGGRVLGRADYEGLEAHAERIFAAVEAAMARAAEAEGGREALGPIAKVACDVGPGSFTGVRVGVASAQGLALALGAELEGIPSLEAMAFAVPAPDGTRLLPVLDARKDEVFVAAYHRAEGSLSVVAAPAHVLRADLGLWLASLGSAPPRLVGEAPRALALEAPLESAGLAISSLPDALSDLPDAAFVALAAEARCRLGLPCPAEPLYVRPPDVRPPAG